MSLLDYQNYNGKKYKVKDKFVKVILFSVLFIVTILFLAYGVKQETIAFEIKTISGTSLNDITININGNETIQYNFYIKNVSPYNVIVTIRCNNDNILYSSELDGKKLIKDMSYLSSINIYNPMNTTKEIIFTFSGETK